MVADQVRLGFIGAGGIAQYHTKYLKDVPGARIVAAADVNPDNARTLADLVGGTDTCDDYRRILDRDDIDAVLVCLPTHLHAEAVIAAAEAGKHILCEKPMARHLKDADRMIEAAEKAGVTLTIGFVRRFDAEWNTMRDIVHSGKLGRPVIWRHLSTGGGPAAPWFLDREQGGGPLLDGAIHNYDFALNTFGPVRRVTASMMNWNDAVTSFDTGTTIIEHQEGDQQLLCWSWGMAPGARSDGLIDVVGPAGGLLWPAPPDLLPDDFDRATQGAFYIGTGKDAELITFQRNDMFADQMVHLVDALHDGKQPRVGGDDGRRALEVGLAVLAAGETGQPVGIG